jgi:predicted DCC family thiol-disulfide oxidoreductase YuxK
MTASPAYPAKVFYDGSCRVCAGEMEVYRSKDHEGRLQFVDIAVADFDPKPYGISLEEFMHQMHVIDRSGTVYRGVEAFRVIWLAFPDSPRLQLLAALVDWPPLRPPARLAYWLFARFRKYLPKP